MTSYEDCLAIENLKNCLDKANKERLALKEIALQFIDECRTLNIKKEKLFPGGVIFTFGLFTGGKHFQIQTRVSDNDFPQSTKDYVSETAYHALLNELLKRKGVE